MALTLRFRGSDWLRQRITLSLLTGKLIIIDTPNGLKEHDRNLLELVEKVTSGTRVQISRDRTHFSPGTIIGGEFQHDCHLDRSISYYLDVLLTIAPFCKRPLQATLNGVTNDQLDPSVDALKASALPVIKRFIGDVEGAKLDIKVTARGFKPDGGGQIVFTCPIVRQLQPVQLIEAGKLRRVRGVAVAARVSPQMANRIVDTSKGKLLQLLPDVYIYSDHNKGKTSGLSPGFSLSLTAETKEGCFFSSSHASNPRGSIGMEPSVPEDIASETTDILFGELNRGGCVDSMCQCLVLTLMAFNQRDVSKVKLGTLTVAAKQFLRHIKEFCGLVFHLDDRTEQPEVIALCQGIGYKNLSRPTY